MNEIFDSNEEMYFSWWCNELIVLGFIRKVEYQPEAFILGKELSYNVKEFKQLKTKIKVINKKVKIFRGSSYKTDAKITWTSKANGIFFRELKDLSSKNNNPYFIAQNKITHVEVKGNFDRNNMTRLAKINIQWVYQVYGVYIQLIVPIPRIKDKKSIPGNALFEKTFIPARYGVTNKTKRKREIGFKTRFLDEYLSLTCNT